MKTLIIILLILLSGCTHHHWKPNKQLQATLISAQYLGGNRYELKLVSRSLKDTITYYERWHSPARKRYFVGGWYTVQWDSTLRKPCDSTRFIPAKLTLNH